MSKLLTKKEVSKILGVTTRTVDEWVVKGKLQKLKAGKGTRIVRFDAQEVNNVLKNKIKLFREDAQEIPMKERYPNIGKETANLRKDRLRELIILGFEVDEIMHMFPSFTRYEAAKIFLLNKQNIILEEMLSEIDSTLASIDTTLTKDNSEED